MKKKVRKRSVRVPAYDIAGTAYNPAPLTMPASANPVNMVLPAQLPTKLLSPVPQVPQGGGVNLGNVVGGIGTAIGALPGLVDSFTGESTATTQGQVVGQSLASVAKGAATGIQAGMAIGGPIGGAVGGALGAITGAIGKKGRYASMTSFTDYDEGTFSTGLRALGGANKRRRRERRRIKANAYDNRDAIRGTSALEADYAQLYGDMGTDTFALGGSTNSLAYVDDGELLRTPDGQISKVPERGKPTDSNLVNIPDGTRILSDSLKVPGTNKTFAQIGEKMIKNKKSKNKDIFALNAAKLNLLNNELIYNLLFELLEQVKAAKGIKPKSKLLIPAHGYGDEHRKVRNVTGKYTYNDLMNDPAFNAVLSGITADNYGQYNSMQDAYRGLKLNSDPSARLTYDDAVKTYQGTFNNLAGALNPVLAKNLKGYGSTGDNAKGNYVDGYGGAMTALRHLGTNDVTDEQLAAMNAITNKNGIEVYRNPYSGMLNYGLLRQQAGTDAATPVTHVSLTEEANPVGHQRADGTGGANVPPKGKDKGKGKTRSIGGNFDWAGLVGSLSTLPGIISDLSTKPEKFDAVYNPYASGIRDVMSGRRYDISAAMAEGKRNRAVSNYNANQFNTNTGANLAYRLQSARNYDNYVAKLRDTKNNVENQYAAEYANTMNDLGRQWVNATNLAVDQNARSRAAARNIQRQGYAEIGQLGQQWAKDYNQRKRDQEMLALYAPFLQASTKAADLELLFKNLPSRYR